MTSKYLEIFDPRSARGVGTGPTAQAEVVTGTHLYAYLQDVDLPTDLVNLTSKVKKSSGGDREGEEDRGMLSEHDENTRSREDVINEIYTISEQCEDVTGEYSHAEQHSAFSKRSLLQEIKHAKEIFSRAFYDTHTVISTVMTADCTVYSPHTDAPSSAKKKTQLNAKNMEVMSSISSKECSSILPNECSQSLPNECSSTLPNECSPILPNECSSIMSADDTLVRDMAITVRTVSGSHKNGSNQSSSCSTQLNGKTGLICLEKALITAAVVSSRDSKNVSNPLTQSHLIVLCRSLTNKCQERESLYCAKVSLTNSENLDLHSRMGSIKKIRLYVGPSAGGPCLPDSCDKLTADFPRSEDSLEDISLMRTGDDCEDDDEEDDDDDKPVRAAAVVCVGTAKGTADGDESNGPRTCLMRIDLKDLIFTAISPFLKSTDNIEQMRTDSACVRNVPVQGLGSSDENVPHRERLLDLELPSDSGRIVLEACAARGVVVVGSSSNGAGGGRAIVVDMENDEDAEEEEGEEEEGEVEEEEEEEGEENEDGDALLNDDVDDGDTTYVTMRTR